MKLLIAASCIFLVLQSCEKHAGDYYESAPAASISFSSPVPGMVKQQGDSIYIRAIAIASKTMHGCDVSIRKANDTTLFFAKHLHDHNDTILVNQAWLNTLPGPMQLEATIKVYLDHDGTTSTKTIGFSIQ